jgi:hypothetical protein
MKYGGMPKFYPALYFVKEKREKANPNAKFWKELQQYEKDLLKPAKKKKIVAPGFF